MRYRYAIFLSLLFSLCTTLKVHGQFYYGLHQNFGKNRVQFGNFDWRFYRYERFDVFFYNGGRDIADQVARMVSRQIPIAEASIDIPIDERIRVFVFNNLSDLKESNLNASSEEAYNTGGVTHFAGTSVFVYFDGSYPDLLYQVKEGLTGVALNNLMYGGFTQNLRNSALLNLPEWYTEGLLAFYSHSYTARDENFVADGVAHGEYAHLFSLTGEKAKIAGHSLWHYIAQTYGSAIIKNILYSTIQMRSIDQGLEYNLGVDSEKLIENWTAFYQEKFSEHWIDRNLSELELRKSRVDAQFSRPAFSPNGEYLAYVSNKLGKYQVHLLNIAENRQERILKGGHLIAQNADYSYPLLAWHPNGKVLAMVIEEEGLNWLYFYNLEDDQLERREFFNFQKVRSLTYSRDGLQFLLSGVVMGNSDIYLYTIRSRSIKAITKDGYSDLDPIFTNNDKFIVFRSNRTDDTLRVNEKVYIHPEKFDLFIYRRDQGNDQVLWRINTPANWQEYQPRPVNFNHFAFLVDDEGPPREYLVKLDSSIAFVDTSTHYNYHVEWGEIYNSGYGAMDYDIHLESAREARVYLRDGRYRIAVSDMSWPSVFEKEINRDLLSKITDSIEAIGEAETLEIEVDIRNYQFEPEALALIQPKSMPQLQTTRLVNNDSLFGKDFPIPTARNYFLTFRRDEFSVQVDNVFDYPQYQPFTGTPGGGLINTGINSMFKVGVVDLMNDYRIVAGFRTDFQPIPGVSLSPNSEFLLGVVNRKKRLNQESTLYRRSQVAYLSSINLNARYITYEMHQKYTWPFSEVDAIRFSAGYRNQRQIILMDNIGAIAPPETDPISITDYGILKMEYVFDDTRKKGVNLYHGLRYKVFSEYYENFSKGKSGLVTAGIDWRHYMPVHREIIWANRFAFGTSFGNEKLLHYLGGVDNQFNPSFQNNTPYSSKENYVFQTVVTNMRGFHQNIRNGNSFAVINSELRVPLIKYIYNGPIQNDFLANFQVIGFGDLGTAWNGLQPYSSENAINTRTIEKPGYSVVLDTQRDPLVGGVGFGLRSRLLGYFFRLDWAWGIEDGRVLDNVFYFSLSTDF